jgi:hypothetical protein
MIARRSIVPALLLCTFPLAGNTGIPMLAVTLPGMVILLLPVIALESVIARKEFSGWWPAWRTIALANLFSTFVGVPWAWLQVMLFQMISSMFLALAGYMIPSTPTESSNTWAYVFAVLFSPAWLVPFRGFEEALYWTVPLSTLVLLLPYCYASYRSELWMAERLLRRQGASAPGLARLLLRANVCSYAVIGFGLVVWLGWALTHPPSR